MGATFDLANPHEWAFLWHDKSEEARITAYIHARYVRLGMVQP